MDKTLEEQFAKVGVRVPRILLPGAGVDFARFAVIACDQHSAEPDYWQQADELVGDAPSALRMMLPEAWLARQSELTPARIAGTMRCYLDEGVLRDLGEGFVRVERQTAGGVRRGLIAALDLEQYDYAKDARTMIRATEDTVVERLPARVAVRETAPLEMPHVMVLVDDPGNRLAAAVDGCVCEPVYDFELMLGGGHLRGGFIRQPQALRAVAGALGALLDASGDGFLYAMGDGNHSFAAAKLYWEQLKPKLTPAQRACHPARFALAEIVNLYEPGLSVEPIHRLLMGVDPAGVQREIGFDAANPPDLQTLQPMLDGWLAGHPEAELEYIHGAQACRALAAQAPDRLAVIFPPFDRQSIFSVVRQKGAFVRKSFSLGSAAEKRYYLECRKITAD